MKNKIISLFTISIMLLSPFGMLMGNGSVLAADPCSAASLRWASSTNRVYITGNVSCTLTDIETLGSKLIPLTQVSSEVWFLGANIFLQNGATLVLHGTSAGGDVNELRLKSNNSSAPFSYVSISAKPGKIDIDGTKITSWDEAANGPDTEYTSFGRALIQVKSFLDSFGTPQESRMDIKNSEVSHLGFFAAESYGLSWKVLGTTAGIFDKVGVFGDVAGNNIHNNYFGAYTFGAQAMNFTDNDVHDNVVYGLDPHDDSDFLVLDGNTVHGNGTHGIICSKRCDHLQITNNESFNNGSVGIMLHRNSTDSVVSNNNTHNNGDTGIAMFDSHNNTVSGNTSKFNKRGLRFSVGSTGNTAENNDLSNNTESGIYTFKGTDLPTTGDGRPKLNTFNNNTVNSNGVYAIRLGEADNNVFSGNHIEGNAEGIFVPGPTTGNQFLANTLIDNGTRGIYLYQSTNATADANSIKGNSFAGIDLVQGSGNGVHSNNIDGGGTAQFGIHGTSTKNADIKLNTVCGAKTGISVTGTGNSISGNTITPTCTGTGTTTSASLSFNSGWNLVTLPLQGSISFTAESFGQLAGADVVARWLADTQEYQTHIVGVPINDFPIENGKGVFVHKQSASSVAFAGTAIPQAAPTVLPGWNMLGWTDAVPTTAQAYGSMAPGIDLVAKFDSANQQWMSFVVGFPVGSFTINRGDGLFVHAM